MKSSFRTFSVSAILFLAIALNVSAVLASDSFAKNDAPPFGSDDLTIWNDTAAMVNAGVQDATGTLVTAAIGKDLGVLADGTVRTLLVGGGTNFYWVSVVVDRATTGTVTRVARLDKRTGDTFTTPNRLSHDGSQAVGTSGQNPASVPVVWDVASGALTERIPIGATGLAQGWDVGHDGAILADDGRGGAWIRSSGGTWTQLASSHTYPIMGVSAYRFTHTGLVTGCDYLLTNNQLVPTLWNTDGSKAEELPRGGAQRGRIWSTAPGAATYGGEVQQTSRDASQAALWVNGTLHRVYDRQGSPQEGKITAILDNGIGAGYNNTLGQAFLVFPNGGGGFTAVSIEEWATLTFGVTTGPLVHASALVRVGDTVYLQASSSCESFTLKFPVAALILPIFPSTSTVGTWQVY